MKSVNKNWLFRIGIVFLAALMVEAISIVQYRRILSIMEEEMDVRSRVVLGAVADRIGHVLELTETTMDENLPYLRQRLDNPDSIAKCMEYLIDDNPRVVGGCIAFIPNYYRSKGRLFEPYASKENGTIVIRQIAGPDHDYTKNAFFQRALETGDSDWSDPYLFGRDDDQHLITYSCPVKDSEGRIVAVCGLDMDLSWLGDTLNAHQRFASAFGLLFTQNGTLVAGPPPSKIPQQQVNQALGLFLAGLSESADKKMSLKSLQLDKDPFWEIVQVYQTDEVFAKMRRMRRHQIAFVLLVIAILLFIISFFVRNENRLRKASQEHARVEGELSVASRIQQEMLPKAFPPFVHGSLEPAREVGGDLFDFFIRDGKVFFCIGDVSGKGVPSAMLMSVAHSLFRMIARKEESPSRILEQLNAELCRGNDSNMFMTFFVACLDLYSGELLYGNAGHDKPFVMSGDDIQLLPAKANLPLGVFPNKHFEEQHCTLKPGSTLLLYTDGLTESKNMNRAQFGREGVLSVLKSFSGIEQLVPSQLVAALSQAAHQFAGDAPQSDDLTVFALYFEPQDIVREEITLKNEVAEVSRLSNFVKDFTSRLDLDRKMASGLRLALEETVVNVINYAYPSGTAGDVRIVAESNKKEVRFTVVDSGTPFDPTTVLEADTTLDVQNRPIGGLGVLLTRKLMDSISYTRRNGNNVLSLTKSLI